MLINKIYYGIILFAGILALLINPNGISIVLLAVIILMPLLSLFITWRVNKKLRFNIRLSATGNKNSPCLIKLRVKSGLSFPAPKISVRVSLENVTLDIKTVGEVIFYTDSKSNDTILWPFKNKYCGLVFAKVEDIVVFDYFGLFSFHRKNFYSTGITILPSVMNAGSVSDNTVFRTIYDSIEYSQTKKGNDHSEIFSIKEYDEGDSIRSIHWKLSSKINSLLVKEFSLPVNNSIYLLLENIKSVGKKNVGKDVLDLLFDTFFSFSYTLLDNNIAHTVAWYDSMTGQINERELKTHDDLFFSINQILSSPAYSDEPYAIKFRETAQTLASAGQTVYFTPVLFKNELEYFETLGPFSVMYCRAGQKDEISDDEAEDSFDVINIFREDINSDAQLPVA